MAYFVRPSVVLAPYLTKFLIDTTHGFFSSLMSIGESNYEWEEEQDWVIVPTDWWRTPYTAVSWIYLQHPTGGKNSQPRQFRGSLFLRSLSLGIVTSAQKRPSYGKERRREGETTLNIDLVGVKGALESVVKYERNVGFYFETSSENQSHEQESFLALDLVSRAIEEEDTRIHKERWNELLEDLLHSPLQDANDSDDSSELGASCSSIGDLIQSTSRLSSIDFSSSECSVDSQAMPSTPRAKSSLHHHVEIKDLSPTESLSGRDDHHSFSRSLSASASSFIPSLSFHPYSNEESNQFPSLEDSLTVSSKLSNFTFPTLNVPISSTISIPSVKLRKDSDGFFTEETTNTTPISLLPPFLQESSHRSNRSRKSRTREIVDRLRSESVPNDNGSSTSQNFWNGTSPKYASYSPSPLLDEFALEKPAMSRRSASEDGSSNHRQQHWPSLSTTSLSSSASTSESVTTSRFSTPEADDDDGWIDINQHLALSPGEKSKRTRELFLALTRRRTDSISSEGLVSPSTNLANENSDGGREVNVALSESSLSSLPKTFHAKRETAKTLLSPSQTAGSGVVIPGTGWIENPSVTHVPVSRTQKEKISKKETRHRRKSSAHNQNYNLGQTPSWGRGSVFQHPMSHPLNPQHHLPLTSFQPTSNPSHTRPHHSHILPSNAASAAPMPYVFSPYPPVAIPVTTLPYPATYNVMHVPTPYAMSVAQPFITPPATAGSAGYGQVHVNSLSTLKGSSVTAANMLASVACAPMSVSVGPGHGATSAKVSSGSW